MLQDASRCFKKRSSPVLPDPELAFLNNQSISAHSRLFDCVTLSMFTCRAFTPPCATRRAHLDKKITHRPPELAEEWRASANRSRSPSSRARAPANVEVLDGH